MGKECLLTETDMVYSVELTQDQPVETGARGTSSPQVTAAKFCWELTSVVILGITGSRRLCSTVCVMEGELEKG